MGIPYGAPDDPLTLMALVAPAAGRARCSRPSRSGGMQLPYVAMAALAGGNVRVGLEDNLYLGRGVLATNGELVERAATILDAMNVRVLGPAEVRERLHAAEPVAERAATASTVGLLGGGVIGGGWAARFLLNGLDVADLRSRPGRRAQARRGASSNARRA